MKNCKFGLGKGIILYTNKKRPNKKVAYGLFKQSGFFWLILQLIIEAHGINLHYGHHSEDVYGKDYSFSTRKHELEWMAIFSENLTLLVIGQFLFCVVSKAGN